MKPSGTPRNFCHGIECYTSSSAFIYHMTSDRCSLNDVIMSTRIDNSGLPESRI